MDGKPAVNGTFTDQNAVPVLSAIVMETAMEMVRGKDPESVTVMQDIQDQTVQNVLPNTSRTRKMGRSVKNVTNRAPVIVDSLVRKVVKSVAKDMSGTRIMGVWM